MRIRIWGARGSLPAPHSPAILESRLRECLEGFFNEGFKKRSDIERYLASLPAYRAGGYGGNTPCIEVQGGDQRLIIDGGSGIRELGYEMMRGPCGKGQGDAHILFTHFHWDHLIGIPFFTPIFIPGNTVNVYAVQEDLPSIFKTLFRKPYFPVPLEGLGAKIVYHRLEPRKPRRFGDLTVTPYQLDHPDPCWGYKFESGGKAFSHCVDSECTRVSREQLGPDLPLYQGLDLMIFDAQYTLMESIEKVNWGHAAASIGVDIALRESVKRVLFMHHDPAASDQKVAAAEQQVRRYLESVIKNAQRNSESVPDLEWQFAREGMIFEL